MSSKKGIPKPILKPVNNNLGLIKEDFDINEGYHLHCKVLGEGGFGTVRLATHLKTGHKVAVKVMNKVKLGADLFRVQNEMKALKVLEHENIAKLFQVIENETDFYLVLEYCSGGELFDYLLLKHKLKEEETKIIMKNLAQVLSFTHEKGFAHRDLKPENILLDDNRNIKLIDFGLSANGQDMNTTLSHLSTCCGSPAYAAPELLEGIDYSGPAVDVWSAGILLYALLVGCLPFDSENLGVLYKKIKTGAYYSPQWLSSEAKDLIKCMLKVNPLERFTIEEVLSHPWLCLNEEKQKYSIQKSKRFHFDEAFWKCKDLFPNTPIHLLKKNILTGFGYQSATYWLIKQNKDLNCSTFCSPLPFISDKNERRRSRSLAYINDNENTPQVNETKRQVIECETLRDFQIRKPDNESNSKVRKVVDAKRIANREFLANSPLRINLLKTTPKAKETKINYFTPLVLQSSSKIVGGVDRQLKGEELKSLTPMRTLTPQKSAKKSLFKRFLETTTPSKKNCPKSLSPTTDSKNLILTNFTDPQLCINKLAEILKARGLQCKQKSFSLRCVLSSLNVIILCFDLEMCTLDNRCVIKRNRLRGDSYHYKRICEEILKISNQ